jgi:cytoskeletal protein CcmA (bactofilin family)
MRGRKDKPVTAVKGGTTLISADTVITGDIRFKGNLDIEGKIVGAVIAEPDSDAMLRVVEGGRVEGEIRVPSALINGDVAGDIHSTDRLELAPQAVIDGDVYYHLVEMAVGCRVNGGLRHVSNVADDLAQRREERAVQGET